jgi:hypothetical protein
MAKELAVFRDAKCLLLADAVEKVLVIIAES